MKNKTDINRLKTSKIITKTPDSDQKQEKKKGTKTSIINQKAGFIC